MRAGDIWGRVDGTQVTNSDVHEAREEMSRRFALVTANNGDCKTGLYSTEGEVTILITVTWQPLITCDLRWSSDVGHFEVVSTSSGDISAVAEALGELGYAKMD